jgi:NADH-quinone oxidoreductase subunit M
VPGGLAASHPLPPITWPEKIGALLLLGATIYLGLSPDTLLNWIRPALQSPAFHAILTGGAS